MSGRLSGSRERRERGRRGGIIGVMACLGLRLAIWHCNPSVGGVAAIAISRAEAVVVAISRAVVVVAAVEHRTGGGRRGLADRGWSTRGFGVFVNEGERWLEERRRGREERRACQ